MLSANCPNYSNLIRFYINLSTSYRPIVFCLLDFRRDWVQLSHPNGFDNRSILHPALILYDLIMNHFRSFFPGKAGFFWHCAQMIKSTTVHIIDEEAVRRGTIARIVYAAGFHAEVYDGMDEFLRHGPTTGVVLAQDDAAGGCITTLMERMVRLGHWLPVIAVAALTDRSAVVAAIKAGALDYLAYPLDADSLSTAIDNVVTEAEPYRAQRDRVITCQSRIAQLSKREREVLDRLADGLSNKEMARALSISSRTVEIHRMKMMAKLGARHAAEAVRLLLYATDFNKLAA